MAFAAFMKIKGIDGESTDDKHKDWIELLSFNQGVSQDITGSRSSGGAPTGGRCNHSDFSVVKTMDKASPKLALACCKGESISEITIELCLAGGDPVKYMEYKLENVVVSSYRPGGSAQGSENRPLEEVSFHYGKISWTYTVTDHKTSAAGANVPTWWDTVENKGG